ncbi:MAG: hypothetical protein HS099_16055 [Ardenticatenaceae bacterium]|nr:hypothetical protein [Ardenticatenaceae bacterium]
MTDNFDWQTEDDGGWDTLEAQPQRTTPPPKRPWPALLVVLVLLATAALVIYWQFNRRIETLTATIEADVLSSHNLVNRAVAGQDMELLAPLLSAREPGWTNTYEKLLTQGLFYDRAPFYLPLAAANEAYTDLSVADEAYIRMEVAPDMNAAELHFLQEHTLGLGEESVMLEHTAVYRRGRTRWLLAPPDADFWGDWQTTELDRLTLIYPQRDTAVAQQLAEDVTAVLDNVCRQSSPQTCPADLRLTLRLDTDPATLLAMADPANLYDGNLRLNLPTPTLVGLPIDEAGYQAMAKGYGAAVAATLITYLAEWDCCAHAPVYQAFLEYQLSQMGLRPWPVTPAIHARIINSGANLDTLFNFWRESSFQPLLAADGWQLYAFVDFFMRQPAAPQAMAILTSFNKPQTLSQWLAGLVGAQQEEGNMVQELLLRDWWLFAHTQLVANQGPLPIPLPDQDLLLTCSTDLSEMVTTTLYRYQLATKTWQVEYSVDGLLFSSPLPGDEAVILQTVPLNAELFKPLLWRDGIGLPAVSQDYPVSLSWGKMDPTGRYLLVYGVPANGMDPHPMLVDMTACDEDGCATIPLSGNPVWSLDGAQTILEAMGFLGNGLLMGTDGRVLLFSNDFQVENVPLSRANQTGDPASEVALPVSGGTAPFWVDEQTYGYIQASSPSGLETVQQIVLATTADDAPQPVLSTQDLLQAIPEASRPFRLAIRYVLPHPTQPDWLVVMATSRAEHFIFLVNWRENVIEYRLRFVSSSPHHAGFSPDGRYLIVTGAPADSFFAPQNVFVYLLHDIAANVTETFMAGVYNTTPAFPFDWSADGRWLAQIMNNGVINLIAPDYDYQTLIVHEKGNCSSLAWVNRK